MIRGNTSDFIGHPLPKDSIFAHGAFHHVWAPGPHHRNPALHLLPKVVRFEYVPGVAKYQQCYKCFLQCNTFAPEKTRFEQGDAKLVSCLGRHLTSGRPCLRPGENGFAGGFGQRAVAWRLCFRVYPLDTFCRYKRLFGTSTVFCYV